MINDVVIKWRICRSIINVVLVFFISLACFLDTAAQQKPSRQSSVDAFTRGDFEEAYKGFSGLLATFPGDPLYKYYSGVCLVNLNRDQARALDLLEQANGSSTVVKTIPEDALFWLGRARQMAGKFEEAIAAYDDYTVRYGRKAAKDLDIPFFIGQCREQKGQTVSLSEAPVREARPAAPELKPSIVVPGSIVEKPLQKNIQRDSVPGGFDVLLAEALENQFKADSLYSISEQLKEEAEKLDYRNKTNARVKITEIETLAAEYQKKADLKYQEAQASMNMVSFAEIKIPAADAVKMTDSLPRKTTEAKVVKDTVSPKKEATPKVPAMIEKQVETLSVFKVVASDENSEEPLQVNAPLPAGLIYRIQIAVFRNPVNRAYFKGITPVYGFKLPENNYTAYYAGMFRHLSDARDALAVVKQKGFRDAFIAAVSGGKTVSLERAASLEKEWGNKPFVIKQMSPLMPADTIAPELCLRVEVLKSQKPVKQDVVDNIKQIAGTRGYEIETTSEGATIILIGKFITFESALSYADLLVRNGYQGARVVARLGKKEVPVETARALFDTVE